MAIRRKYAVGDVFELVLDSEGSKGYGRILDVNKPAIFVELFAMSRDFVLDVAPVFFHPPIECSVVSGWQVLTHVFLFRAATALWCSHAAL